MNARRILPAIAITALLVGCGRDPLTMLDVEHAGFEVTQEKMYSMVGAIDGAGGSWTNDEAIEVYIYDRKGAISDAARRIFPGMSYTTVREYENVFIVCKTVATCNDVVANLRGR